MITESVENKAESMQCELDTLRVLVDAVDAKVCFFITEKSMFGPHADLIKALALDIQTLLSVLNDRIWDMERAQDELIRMLGRMKRTGEGGAAQ